MNAAISSVVQTISNITQKARSRATSFASRFLTIVKAATSHRFRSYSWKLAIWQGAFLILALFWLQWFFPSYYPVTVAGVVGIIMSVRAEEQWGRTERIIWIVVGVAFALAAIRCFGHEDYQRRIDEAGLLNSEMSTWSQMAAQNQQHFEATMSKEDALAVTAQRAAQLAKLNLESVTGQDSFPCIVPQSHASTSDGAIPLVVWNKGPNVLTGVEVRLLSMQEFLSPEIFFKPPTELGTLRPEWPKPLSDHVIPVLDENGVAIYMAEIWTQNGYFVESLNFRRGKYRLPWAYRYWLSQQNPFEKNIRKAVALDVRARKACGQEQWSDDLGDGKPVPQTTK